MYSNICKVVQVYIIYEERLSIPELNKTLVMDNIEVERIYVDEESLEDYFIRVTGGTGIA
ncbi:MAG TPA: hypothetical protein GX727_01720 [Clostridium sp.]|nr:hypothetical protein [Clostridium sp.]